MFRMIKVSGHSLHPAYRDGDFVFVSKIPYLFRDIKSGDVIVFNHPARETLIKKVDRVDPDTDEIHVVGTHPNSADSRSFGVVSKRDIIGKVIWQIKKPRG